MSTPRSSFEDTATPVKETVAATEKPIRGRIPSEEPEPGFSLTPRSAPKLEGIQDFRKIWPEAIEWFGELFEALSPDSGYLGDLFSGSFRRISSYGVTSLTELENMFEQFCASIPSNFRPSLEPEISKLKGVFDFAGELLVEKMVTAIRDGVAAKVAEFKPSFEKTTQMEWVAEWLGKKEEIFSFIDKVLRIKGPFIYDAVEFLCVWLEGQKRLVQTRYEEALNGQAATHQELLAKVEFAEGAEERIGELTARGAELEGQLKSERMEVVNVRQDNEQLRAELEAKQTALRMLQTTMLGQSIKSIRVIRDNGGILVLTDRVEALQRVIASLVRDLKVLGALYREATGKDFDGDTDLSKINMGEITIRPKVEAEDSAEIPEEPEPHEEEAPVLQPPTEGDIRELYPDKPSEKPE